MRVRGGAASRVFTDGNKYGGQRSLRITTERAERSSELLSSIQLDRLTGITVFQARIGVFKGCGRNE